MKKILTSNFANFLKSFLGFETIGLNWPYLITGGGKKIPQKDVFFFSLLCATNTRDNYTLRVISFFKLFIKIPIMLGSKSHLLIFTSAYLRICSLSYLLTFTFLLLHFSSSYHHILSLHVCSSSHLPTSHFYNLFALSPSWDLSFFRPWVVPARVEEM